MRARLIALLCLLILPFTAVAETDFRYFQNLPVMHEGRVKPLGSFGSILLETVSGHTTYQDMSSNEWLVRVLFDPSWAEKEKFFLVKNRAVIQALSLPKEKESYYSFAELNKAFIEQRQLLLEIQKEKEPNGNESDLLALFTHVSLFEQVKDSMTLLLPLNENLTDVQKKKIESLLVAKGRQNEWMRVIPGAQDAWVSVWEAFLQKKSDHLLEQWRQLASSYVDNDRPAFAEAAQQLFHDTLAASGDRMLSWRLPLENIYRNLHLYVASFAFYLAALLLLLFTLKNVKTAQVFLISGFILHGLGIVLRMTILQRPPVSTLYESLLFVGLVIVAFGLVFSRRYPKALTLTVAALAGVLLHLVGFGLTDEQDNLKVLQAVLDTKFWLATHVIMITTGYAFTLLTSLFAQAALYQQQQKLSTITSRLALWSLAFVATGTILGGIWADQSWGRFWGWDPKENGALLIVLWIVWLLHGKVAKQLTQRHVLVGYAVLSIIVALSWVGTNLLGVGLHSYGFITGVAGGLFLFVTVQSIIIFWLNGRIGKHGPFELS